MNKSLIWHDGKSENIQVVWNVPIEKPLREVSGNQINTLKPSVKMLNNSTEKHQELSYDQKMPDVTLCISK